MLLSSKPLPLSDMQGLIVRGYKSLTAATYILLKITDVPAAKEYFKFLAKDHITAGKQTGKYKKLNNDPHEAVNIAFTGTGIANLLDKETFETFSREFREGMSTHLGSDEGEELTERTIMLGDLGRNHPSGWHWGNGKKPVDVMLMLFAKNKTALDKLINEVFCDRKQGVEIVYVAGTYQYDTRNLKEHFGFKDGISQPTIKGLSSKEQKITDKSTIINTGEFILGYKNEYDNYSPSPYVPANTASSDLKAHRTNKNKKDLGRNGTYLVFRQMEQYVEAFWKYLYENSKEAASSNTEKAVKLGAKMVGRWPDGRPLVQAPSAACPVHDTSLNDFNYAETDKYGVLCPLGAHIRRTNPRDHTHAGRGINDSLELSKKHRMLRRGRIYGEPLDKDFNIDNMIHHYAMKPQSEGNTWNNTTPAPVTTCVGIENENARRGLHFICLVSDISRQFEFVQNVWANTSTFADLCNEVDPIISPRPTPGQPNCHEFTTPQEIVRNRYLNVPEFTTVVGGAYFFMPGIEALKYIVNYGTADKAG